MLFIFKFLIFCLVLICSLCIIYGLYSYFCKIHKSLAVIIVIMILYVFSVKYIYAIDYRFFWMTLLIIMICCYRILMQTNQQKWLACFFMSGLFIFLCICPCSHLKSQYQLYKPLFIQSAKDSIENKETSAFICFFTGKGNVIGVETVFYSDGAFFQKISGIVITFLDYPDDHLYTSLDNPEYQKIDHDCYYMESGL